MGTIRGHHNGVRGRMNGRPSSDAGGSEHAAPGFPASRTSSNAGLTAPRRFRGFQPSEVNKPRSKLQPEASPSPVEGPPKPVVLIEDGPVTNTGAPAKAEAAVTPQPLQSTTLSNQEALTKASATPASEAKNGQPQSTTAVPQKLKPGNDTKDTIPDRALETAAFEASKPKHNTVNLANADEPSPSDFSSVQVITNDEPQKSYLSRALPAIETSPFSEVSTPKGTWDNSMCDIDKPAWLRNEISHPSDINSVVNIDWRNLPPYKSPFKEDGSATKKSPRDLVSSSFGRQLANLKQSGEQLAKAHAQKANSPILDNKKATAEAAQPLVDGPPEKPSANLTAQNESNKVAPHLRAQLASSVAATMKGGQTFEDPAGKVAPHLRVFAGKSQASVQTEVPREANTNTVAPKAVIDIDEELAAGQYIVNTENDAEIAAAMAVEGTNGDEQIISSAHKGSPEIKTPDQELEKETPKGLDKSNRTPPHLRRSKAKAPDEEARPEPHSSAIVQPVVSHKDDRNTINATYSGALKDVTTSQQNAKVKSAQDGVHIAKGNTSTAWKGKKPMNSLDTRNDVSNLIGWDGQMAPAPIGGEWMNRDQFDSKAPEMLNVIKTWAEDNAAEMQAGFTRDDDDLMNSKGPEHPETIPNPDEFNQAKRHFSAAHAIEAYGKKRSLRGSPTFSPEERLTREERRNNRRLFRQTLNDQIAITNEHAPAANIYLRPAEMADMRQVMQIHNHYVNNSACANELEENDEIYWRSRFQESHDEHDPFLVAIHTAQVTTGDTRDMRRKRSGKKGETIVGFAFAADYGIQKTAYRYTVELEIWVHHTFHHQGIGRTMLDRMLGAMDPGYNLLECAPMRNCDTTVWMSGGRRIIKTILVNLLHCRANEASLEWKKKWLSNNNFEYQGTLKEIGFKNGQALHQCQMAYKTYSTLAQGVNAPMNGL